MISANRPGAIDTVIFDLGNVLINWDPRHLYRKLFGQDVEGMERFLADVCPPHWNEQQDAGRTWEEGIKQAVALHPEQEMLIRAYRERWDEMLGGVISESVAVLDQLRKGDIRLFALTNWSHETFPMALQRYEFLSWFRGILVSGQERLIKPDPAIFRLLLSRFDIDAARAVFIDDNIRNVEGARHVGLHALHFTDAQRMRLDLRALGLPV